MAKTELIIETNAVKVLVEIEGAATKVEKKLKSTKEAADETAEATKTLAAQFKELKKEQDQYDPGTEKFDEISRKMGELKDRMNDAADAVKGNTGPAIEGMSNSFGMMQGQLENLDFEGLTQSLKMFTGNLARVDTKALTAGLKEFMKAGIQGFATLAKVILTNPLLLIVGIIAAIAMNWDKVLKLWNSSDISALKRAQEVLEAQNKAINEQIALEKARGKYGEETYFRQTQVLRNEIEILKLKQKQLELEGDSDEAQKANEERQKKILDLKQAQIEADGKIFQAVENAKGVLDPAVALQQKKRDAAKEELGALELIKQRQQDQKADLETMTAEIGKYQSLLGKEVSLRDKLKGLVDRGVLTRAQAMQMEAQAGNSLKGSKKLQEDINKLIQDKIAGIDGEIKGIASANGGYAEQMRILSEAANKKMAEVKSEAEIAAEKEAERKKEEAAAEAKQKREKALADAEAKRKEIAQQTVEIHKQIDEFNRRNLSDKDKELYLLDDKYKKERKILEQSAEGKKLLLQFDEQYLIAKQELDEKYAKIANEKRIAQLDSEFAIAQELEKDQQQKEIDALIATYESKFLVVKDNQDLEKQLTEQFEADKDAIVKKYRDKQNEENAIAAAKELDDQRANNVNSLQLWVETNKAKFDSSVEWAEKGADALQSLGDAVFATQLNNVEKGSKAEEDIKRKQFKFNKAMQLSGAIIDSAKAVIASLAQSPVAIGPVPNPAGIASLALVGITSAANIAKIAATKFESTSAGSTSTPSANISGGEGGSSAPAVDIARLTNRPQQQQPFQAYVLSGQVASSMEAQQLIKNQSKL